MKWSARLTTLAAVITLVMVFVFITQPVWFLFPVILIPIIVIIAWVLPETDDAMGGIMVIGGVVALINIFPMNYDLEYTIALIAPWIILSIGGILFLIDGWRQYIVKKQYDKSRPR